MSKVIPFQRRLSPGVAASALGLVAQAAAYSTAAESVDLSKLSDKRKSLEEVKNNPIYRFVVEYLEVLGQTMRNTYDTKIDYVDLGLGFFMGTTDANLLNFILYGLVKPTKDTKPDYTADKFITIKAEQNEQAYKLTEERNAMCMEKVTAFLQEWTTDSLSDDTPAHYFAPHVLLAFAFSKGFYVTHYNLRAGHKQSKEFFIGLFNPKTNVEYRVNVDFGAMQA